MYCFKIFYTLKTSTHTKINFKITPTCFGPTGTSSESTSFISQSYHWSFICTLLCGSVAACCRRTTGSGIFKYKIGTLKTCLQVLLMTLLFCYCCRLLSSLSSLLLLWLLLLLLRVWLVAAILNQKVKNSNWNLINYLSKKIVISPKTVP